VSCRKENIDVAVWLEKSMGRGSVHDLLQGVLACLFRRQQMTIDDRGYIKVKIGISG
jgi:hypothetical protein